MATRPLFLVALGFSAPALTAILIAACGGGDSSGVDNGSGGETAGPTTTSTGGASTSSSGAGPGGMGGGATGCASDADCTVDPATPVCDTATGNCVGCLPSNDTCAMGQYCDPTTFKCTVGCTDDTDCDPANGLLCNKQLHKCVGCVIDTDCPQGSICVSDTCVPGCSGAQPCQAGFTCCGQTCFDTGLDVDHCGDCNTVCEVPPNAAAVCLNGQCAMGACTAPFADCDGDIKTGCEQNTLQDGDCVCMPGTSQSCYQGAPGTENVGPCTAGTQDCDADGLGWLPCMNQVLPTSELCANGVDEDCDGTVDNGTNQDNDGWTSCPGEDDCDDSDPLVNPGAFEFVGNGVDDDCDAATSDTVAAPACSTVQKFSSVLGDDLAKAMDLCQFTTANPPKNQQKWGVLSAAQKLANGNNPSATQLSNMQNFQTAVLVNYGTGGVVPQKNATMAGFSSGRMRDQGDAGWVTQIPGSDFATTIAFPGGGPLGVYTSAHGGNLLPGQCNGNPCQTGIGANDSVDIQLQIRVPTNAQSFSYSFRFFSAEYQSYQCTAFNDYYLAELTTGAMGIPVDHNISFDGLGNAVSVNNGFFDVCGGNGKNCGACPLGTGPLAGTGLQTGGGGVSGGGTAWLTTDAPIVPGETMTLDLLVFDVNDHIYDTMVILDNWVWNVSPAAVGTHD